MHYYQHNIGSYRRDTAHLSLLEHGVYRQLLDMYYLAESAIPEETEVVMRRLCARTDEEKKAVEIVLSEFFTFDCGWHHKRCDEEILDYQLKADRARNNGKLGGRPRKTKEVISGNPEATDEKANSLTHELTNNTPIPPEGGERKRRSTGAISFVEYLEYCKDHHMVPIPDDCEVFAYAAKSGIPLDFLRLQWLEFKARYSEPGAKKYKSWTSVFCKSVRNNWFKLWYADRNGGYALTTTGVQADNTHKGVDS